MAEGKKAAPKQQQQPSKAKPEAAPEEESPKAAVDEQQPDSPLTGKVKWFSSEKGFGFISPDDGSPDLFVHQTSVKADGFRSLRVGEPVEYELETGQDGRPRAANVTGPNGANVQGEDDGFYAPAANSGGSGRGGGRGGRGGAGGVAGGGGGGGGFGRGGGGGGVCYSCNQPGHLARDCTSGGRRSGCYQCGEQGHFARDCTNAPTSRGGGGAY